MLIPVDLKEKVRLGRCMWMFESQRPSGNVPGGMWRLWIITEPKTLWYSWRLLLGGAGYQSKISQLCVFLTRSRFVFFLGNGCNDPLHFEHVHIKCEEERWKQKQGDLWSKQYSTLIVLSFSCPWEQFRSVESPAKQHKQKTQNNIFQAGRVSLKTCVLKGCVVRILSWVKSIEVISSPDNHPPKKKDLPTNSSHPTVVQKRSTTTP